jgi:PKD repeat protein
MMLLVLPGAVSAADLSVSGNVVDEDLSVTALAINPGSSSGHDVISANEPNTLRATVANTGGLAAGAFDVTIVIGAFTQTVNVASLGAGATTTVDFTYTPTATGAISIVTTADSGSVIAESDEANNALTTPSTVYYNGYKGKRYTAGNDFTTVDTYTGRDGVVYSTGNAAYQSANWMSYSASFTAAPTGANLNIPSGATIVSARLYQSTNWDQTTGASALWTATFNGGTVTPTATYTDRKGYGLYNYPSESVMYDVTSTFNPAGTNTWNLAYGSNLNVALYPTYMVVVFQDAATQTEKMIYINDECDILQSRATYNTNDAEATSYAPFTGVDITGMGSAKAIAFVAAVNEDGDSKFHFNDVVYDDFYISTSASTSQTMSIKEFTLTNVIAGANEAKMQSAAITGDGDGMQPQNLILVIEKSEGAPDIDFSADNTAPAVGQTLTFTATNIGGSVSSWAWTIEGTEDTDYEYTDGTTSASQNPKVKFLVEGSYDVSLTATGPGGSDTESKSDYIQVGEGVIEVLVVPASIDFGTMQAGVDETGSTAVTVTTTYGTTWSVDVSASDGGFMMSGSTPLSNAFELANGVGAFHAMSTDFTGFMTGTPDEDQTDIANVKQVIAATDAPGSYTITLTFLGGFV